MSLSVEQVKDVLSKIEDPALLLTDLIKHRLIGNVDVSGSKVKIEVIYPTDAYLKPERDELCDRITKALTAEGAKKVKFDTRVETAFMPPTSGQVLLPGVKNIIAVAAGKGGVGKSTVATNIALALRDFGAKVGILDADVFGPSLPTMLGEPEKPPGTASGDKIVPAIHHGIKVISVGFFTDPKEAVVWRGPMVHKLLQQFLGDVLWGDLDYLICDLPPGTGDVQLSLSQLIPITGAVMVTTPQEVSIVDVVKGISMFKKVEIPLIGVVENMSYYECSKCGDHDEIFSHGGGKRLAEEIGVQFLGELPLDARIRFGGDTGVPIIASAPESDFADRFRHIASKAALEIAGRVLSQPKRSKRLSIIS
ncbi:MAG: iron-sulfur cluster carrier protein ApbC [Kofleriaceae bacterium]|nr:iron-sulfur cluster carrier protein ApbC [Kofleriaceae bacterium]